MRILSSAALMLAASTSLLAQTGPSAAGSAAGTLASAVSEAITFKNGNSTINGVIENVAGNGQHGAVVIITNGDADAMATAKKIAKDFAAKGVIALTYDSPSHSAADAAAAIDLLRQRGDVLHDKVGIVALDGTAAVATECSQAQNVLYTVSLDKTVKPEVFGKLSQKTLVVQGTDDAFSPSADKLKAAVEKHCKNVTLWLAPNDDVAGVKASDSSLMDRVTSWVVDRNA